jgi:transposase-like protein
MLLLEFFHHYPTESSCKAAYRSERERLGVRCQKCGSSTHYWLPSIEKWQCKTCRYRTSLRKGTVMEGSKLPFQIWFQAMHLMTATKKGISALEMQRQLNYKRYEPIWAMMHKLRSVMGQRDDRYQLSGNFELDEGFFEKVILDKEKREEVKENGLKRGRGSERQAKVLVMIESDKVLDHDAAKHEKDKACRYLKMQVLQDLKADSIEEQIKKHVSEKASVETDHATSYNGLNQLVERHQVHNTSNPDIDVNKVLPWVHTAISNAKRKLNGVYHMIGDKYMQNYLNEFCYGFNRRFIEGKLFERLLIAAVSLTPIRME